MIKIIRTLIIRTENICSEINFGRLLKQMQMSSMRYCYRAKSEFTAAFLATSLSKFQQIEAN